MRLIIRKNIDTVVISSNSLVCKTDGFAKEHSRFLGLDRFISQFAEGLLQEKSFLEICKAKNIPTAKLSTTDGAHVLYVRFGFSLKSSNLNDYDIVFYALEDNAQQKRKNDSSLSDYLANRDVLEFAVEVSQNALSDSSKLIDKDFKKLFVLFNSDQVNFPLLNRNQLEIVESEKNNVLVQGVAGSGKTNICIDKIIYTACKGYFGKTLYTTFSRGLLIDTISKVQIFKKNIKDFLFALKNNKVIFADANKKKAVENKLGLFLNVEMGEISNELERILFYLENKVDFKLLPDLYASNIDFTLASEDFFVKDFGKVLSTKLSGKFSKVSNLSIEVLYKEIYGMIFGCSDQNDYSLISLNEYIERRKDSFSPSVCEVIYSIALDYEKFCASNNALDNNFISRKLIENAKEEYSLAVIDEVQDFTEINLCLIKKLSRRMFCVGDAMQMINPSFFSFAYLKRLLYEENAIAVSKLENNYRNTRQITEAINKLNELNISKFGTHNFVLKGQSVEEDAKTITVYFPENGFANSVRNEKLDNFTIVVSSVKRKDALRKILNKQEILTVSEIKGLERDTVVLFDVLSDNEDKWSALERMQINRKKADENSVYRYYFNLFYVGVSRAKFNLFVVESKKIPLFNDFFAQCFKSLSAKDGFNLLSETVSKVEIDSEELHQRIEEFLRFSQYDNARFTANKLDDDLDRKTWLVKIDVHERFIQKGDYQGAGIALWSAGVLEEAKKMFRLSGAEDLVKLVDECEGKGSGKLDTQIVRFYPNLSANPAARKIILDTLDRDCRELHDDFIRLKNIFSLKKEKKNGKK